MSVQQPFDAVSQDSNSWFSSTNAMSRIVGFSFLATIIQGLLHGQGAMNGRPGNIDAAAGGQSSYVADSIRLFLLGSIIEGGRRFFSWIMGRFKLFQYSITAQFAEGDPAYEWIILLLTEEQIWTRSREFRVNATSSLRQWSVKLDSEKQKKDGHFDEHAEYVPTYEEPQLFRWKGYWVEVRRFWGNGRSTNQVYNFNPGLQVMGRLYLTMYTRNMGALSAIVEEARERYVKTSRPHVIVHTADQPAYGPASPWNGAKRKARRPLSSIILQEGVINSLIEDAREFIRTEEWYTKAGIPHRRGYLLYGPPGTGKSSTIYAIAGELGLEIYSLSLASAFVDDSFLARAVSSIPKQAIFLIEDIDCAFPSREDLDDDEAGIMAGSAPYMAGMVGIPARPGVRGRSAVTMSGLLNVLDGVGSEEGKIFFATTNYVDRLDPALLRPGRIDKKIPYKLATRAQAAALFLRFYPEAFITLRSVGSTSAEKSAVLSPSEKETIIRSLSEQFAAAVPEHEFSTAELQGFLLSCKQDPERAVEEVTKWVEDERNERAARAKKEEEEKAKKQEKKEAREAKKLQGGLARLGVNTGGASGPLSPGAVAAPVLPGPGPLVAGPTPEATGGTTTNGTSPQPVNGTSAIIASPESNPVSGASEGPRAGPAAIAISTIKPQVNGVHAEVNEARSGPNETPN